MVVFEQLDPLHRLDCLALSHVVRIESAALIVQRDKVLLQCLHADEPIPHQMVEHNLHLLPNHFWLLPIQINLQTMIGIDLLRGI